MTELPPQLISIPPWKPVLFEGHCPGFAAATELLFTEAIEPACNSLAERVGEEPKTPDERTNAKLDGWEDLRTAELEMHRSFALALGGMWERHFRQHLWHSAITVFLGDEHREQREALLKTIERGRWADLCRSFQRVRGFPLNLFPMFAELELLNLVASAVRHGTGAASRSVHERREDLFMDYDVRSGYFAYFTLGGEEAWSINKLDLPLSQLRAFKDAAVGFWHLVGLLRQQNASL